MKPESVKRRQYDLSHLNGCDWHDCNTCPHSECISDIDKALEWQSNRRKRNREYSRKRFNYLKENKLCIRCHKVPAVEGKSKCSDCLEKSRLETIRYRQSHPKPNKLRDENLCYVCQKKPCYGEHKVCYDCYQIKFQAIQKARKSIAYKIAHEQVSNSNHKFFVKID